MKIVALETSHLPGQVALLSDGEVIYDASLPADRRTTESFAVQLYEAFRIAGWQPSDVDLFAVSEGPGSFTGLRIGVTAAKTFAYATEARVIAINTLDVLAAQAWQWSRTAEPARAAAPRSVWAAIDAQRRQLYVAQYEYSGMDRSAANDPGTNDPGTQDSETKASQDQGAPLLSARASDVTLVDGAAWLKQFAEPDQAILTGSGLAKFAAKNELPAQIRYSGESCWAATAVMLGQLAIAQAGRQSEATLKDFWSLVPKYYRKSAAEENRTA